MGLEIERKWLVAEIPADLDRSRGQKIDQGYLTIGRDGAETRIRSRAGSLVLTTKSGSGLVRQETSIELSSEQYDTLWPTTEGARVSKTRHEFELTSQDAPRTGMVIEVDVYSGDLAGLVVAEIEFASEDEAAAFEPPDWFGTEVTSDAAYKNHALAVQGRP